MFKKLLTATLALGMLGASATSVTATTPRPARWIQNTFVNEAVDVAVYLPIGWWRADLETVPLRQDSVDVTAFNLENYTPLMLAYSAFGEDALYMSQYILPAGLTHAQIVTRLEAYLGELGAEILDPGPRGRTPVDIGGRQWHFMRDSIPEGRYEFYTHTLFNVTDGVLTLIKTSSWADLGMYIDLLDAVRYIGSDTPDWYVVMDMDNQPNHTLVGDWAWDGHRDWLYEFFAEGWGYRGFPGEEQRFRWSVVYGEPLLVMTFLDGHGEFAHELWTFYFRRNILGLESLQVEGMSFIYHYLPR